MFYVTPTEAFNCGKKLKGCFDTSYLLVMLKQVLMVSSLWFSIGKCWHPLRSGYLRNGNCLLIGVTDSKQNATSLEVDLLRDQMMILANIDPMAQALIDVVVPLKLIWSTRQRSIVVDIDFYFHRFIQSSMKYADCGLVVSDVARLEPHEHGLVALISNFFIRTCT